MDCSIIIVNYNTSTLIIQAINALKSTIHNLEYEILVIDNDSTENIDGIKKTHPDVTLIKLDKNIGFGCANNVGVNNSTGRNVFFLNPDTIAKDGAIEILSNYLDANEKVGACGANLFNAYGEPTHSFKRIFPSLFLELSDALCGIPVKLLFGKNSDFNHTEKPLKVAYICGADLMVKRSVFNQVGGFDKDIFMYYEDSLLCNQVTSLGYNIMSIPQSEIIHLEGKSFRLNTNREQRVFEGRAVFFSKVYSVNYIKVSNLLNKCLLFLAIILCNILKNKQLSEKYKFRLSLYNQNK